MYCLWRVSYDASPGADAQYSGDSCGSFRMLSMEFGMSPSVSYVSLSPSPTSEVEDSEDEGRSHEKVGEGEADPEVIAEGKS